MYQAPYYGGGNRQSPQKQSILTEQARKYWLCGLGGISVFFVFVLFFVSFCTNERLHRTLRPISALSFQRDSIVEMAVFVVLLCCLVGSIACLLNALRFYSKGFSKFAAKIRTLMTVNAGITGLYYVGGIVYCTVRNYKSAQFSAGGGLIPFLLAAATAVAAAALSGGLDQKEEKTGKKTLWRIEFYLYGTAAALLTVVSCLSDILQVTFIEPSGLEPIKINGLKLLTSYSSQQGGFQLLAFFLIAILTVSAALLLASTVSMFSRSKLFYRLTLGELFFTGISSLLIGLFGKYYEVVQKLNQDLILSLIGDRIEIGAIDFTYKVKSGALIWFLLVAAVILVTLIRKPYTKGTMGEADIMVSGFSGDPSRDEADLPAAGLPKRLDSDPCPAFTELDAKTTAFRQELEAVRRVPMETPTLPGLVQFVVAYARDSRLHLSYSAQDIAAFIAGLGSTRLTILQGMSGTGKTSLPKIFTEAVLGCCDLIEVESSWRDKSELLGYYNEFSRTYTPKKFTQALYKARLRPERLTFIVLDEMNLSRIEYYFSDFLSLMENEAHKREIKLLNVGLFRRGEGKIYPYFGLTEGHTVKIPQNVWFIGTANRDESTFEISDKVYDRAHTMNFNRRAPKVSALREPIPPRYLSVSDLNRLFEEAKATVRFDIESAGVIRAVEDLLAPYNISFGNRIANQIEDFVRIYAACFAPSEAILQEALETILLSKVVCKLEFKSIDNKDRLAAEFADLNLHRCAAFIQKLNED